MNKADGNSPLNETDFLAVMIRYILRRSDLSYKMSKETAQKILNNTLHGEKIKYGAKGYDWNSAAAKDLVDEEFSYWTD